MAPAASATSDLYRNTDGSYTRVVSAAPVNYQGADGGWHPIDTRVVAAADKRWHVVANRWATDFAATGTDPALVSLRIDAGHGISYGLAGAAPVPAAVSGSTVTYPRVLPGTDLVLDSIASGVKESLVLRSTQAATSWVFPLRLAGLTARMGTGGSVEFVDGAGVVVARVPHGYMHDAKLDRRTGGFAESSAVTYSLVDSGGQPALRLSVDVSWVHDPARVFPITVDPSYTAGASGSTWVISDSTGDFSGRTDLPIGTWDNGGEIANTFLAFSGLGSFLAGQRITSAQLKIFDYWASTCTPERFDVAPVTQSWTVAGSKSYPGPSRGSSIGNLTADPGAACTNTGGDPSVGTWMTVGLGTDTFNTWTGGGANNGLTVYGSTTGDLTWKRFDSVNTANPPQLILTYTPDQVPQIDTMYPPKNFNATTLTPELIALGHDPDSWPQAVKYTFTVYNADGSTLVTSPQSTSNSWVVPASKLAWSKTYYWSVLAYDGYAYSATTSASYFTTTVPQPLITSGLAQNSGNHGFDPSGGNYTTSVTDAQVQTVGPSLSVQRDYNSLDPRPTQSFGAGWSSVYDMKAAEVLDSSGTVIDVIITYPSGEQVEFGRNADGSFAPPQGRYATLTALNPGYRLVDKSGTTYVFDQPTGVSGTYAIHSISDFQHRTETFTYTGGLVSTATSGVSGRALHFTWSTPSGATSAHVASVTTDPVTAGDPSTILTWTYSYSGDQLTAVCPPTSPTACTRYGYTTGSHFRTTVIDAGPRDYWRLADPAGATTATDQMLINENTLNGTYQSTTMPGGPAGPLADGLSSATFDGASNALTLPASLATGATYLSIGLWFQTTATSTATLFSTSTSTVGQANPSSAATPVLYVGSDGKLYGHFWNGTAAGIATSSTVNDGRWHYVVLTAAGNTQTLYLDGAAAGTQGGQVINTDPVDLIGAGVYNNNGWPAAPAGNSWNYFHGQIAEVAYYTHPLTAAVIGAQYATVGHPANLLTTITRPSGKTDTTVAYHTTDDNVTRVTDINGGTWTIGAPTVSGSSKVYAGAVLGSAPIDYWRLGETGVSQAVNTVRGGTATYNTVTLGATGAFGAGDDTAASFNGTSSFMQLPSTVFPSGASSQELWFNTTATGGVLLSAQASTIGATTCPCLPVLWITSDGKLRGLSPSTTPSGPLVAASLAGKCMDLNGGNTTNGTKVQVWTCSNNNPNQNWTLWTDGSVHIFGKCLDATGGGTTNGTKLELWDCNGGTNQVWQSYNGGLRNPVSQRCLDDPGASTVDGTQFELYDCNTSAAQRWYQSLVTPAAVNDGKWHHAVLTSTGTVQSLYLDGTLVDSTTGTVTLTPGGQPYPAIGAGYTGVSANGTAVSGLPLNTTAYYTGTIDETAFYPTALSAADVARHWAAYRSASGIAPVQTVQVTDPGNAITTYTFDPQNGNRPLSVTDGLGNKTSYGYDVGGFLHTVTDPNGDVTTTGHDVRGNTVSQTTCQNQAANACSTTYYTYYPDDTTPNPPADQRNDLVLTMRDGRSAGPADNTYLTSYSYDTAGNRTTVTTPPVPGFPSGRTSTTVYTDGTTQPALDTGAAPAGLVASATTPGGATEAVSYYHNGDPGKVVDPAGEATSYTYDGIGRVVTKAVVSDAYPGGLTSSYTYDGQGRPLTITDPPVTDRVTGAVHTARTTNVYDVDGDTTSTTVSDLTGGDAARTVTNAFDAGDRVATATTATGAATTYTYDPYGNRASETDPAGNQTTFAYDPNGHLLSTTLKAYTGDPANPSAPADLVESSRAYDPAGRLASVTDSMGWVTAYTYTDNGLTATITRKDPAHNTSFVQQSNSYDAAGNLTTRTSNNGTTTTSYTVDAAARTTSATLDPTGLARTTSYTFSPDDFILSTRMSDPTGVLASTDTTVDALGHTTSRTVHDDSPGHPVGWWKLDESAGLTADDSSGTGQPGVLSGSGWSWNSGALTFTGTGGGASTGGPVVDTSKSFSVSAWTNPSVLGTAWQDVVTLQGKQNGAYLEYDPTTGKWEFSRALTDTTNPSFVHAYANAPAQTGVWTHLVATYDAGTGTMTLYVNGTANGTASDTTPFPTSGPLTIGRGFFNGSPVNYLNGSVADVQVYDRALSATDIATLNGYGRTGGALNATLLTSRWVLDQRGLPTAMTDPAGNTTTYTYDEAGKQSVVVAPTVNTETDGGTPVATHPVTTTGYDTFGEPVETCDPDGNTTTAGYDAAGRVVSTRLPAYTPPGSSTPITPVATKTYTSLGQVATTTDPLNHTTTYTYDQLGDLATATDPAGGVTHHSYDTNGDPLASTDPAGAQTQATYDYLGRPLTATQVVRQNSAAYTTTNTYTGTAGYLTSTTTPGGVTTSYGYDTAGEPTTTTDTTGDVTTVRYDGLGRTIATVLPDGTSTTRTLDEAGRQTATTDLNAAGATLRTTSLRYDADGHVTAFTDPLGNTTTMSYDATGVLVGETQPVSATTSITTTFGYDVAGNRTRFTDGRANPVITTYNPWNLPESTIEPATPAYPNLVDRTFTTAYNAAGQPATQTSPGGVVVTNSYDSRGDLTSQTGTGAAAPTNAHTYGYDPDRRITTASAPGGTDTFTYDDRGLLLSTAGPSGTSSFTYTSDGKPGIRTDAAGTSGYTYDTDGRLHTLTDAATSAVLTYGYNPDSQLGSINYGVGKANRTYTYNSLHQLTADTLTNPSGTTEASITYGYDLDGNETAKTTTGVTGASANTYTYDQAGRLTSWNNGTTTIGYAYDASGNRTQAGSRTFSYDARNELTSDGTSTYTYTPRGTLATTTTGTTTVTATSDAFNRVITDGTQTYSYDALDRVVTAHGYTFAYTGVGNDVASDGTATYSRGPDGQPIGVTKTGTSALLLTDQHTDVVADFTPSGTSLTGSTSYDPFGATTAANTLLGNLGYQSGWTDSGTAKVNMASRWYNPTTGQFTSRDTATNPPAPNPVAANRFQYANDNPLTTTDPTGHCGGWFCGLAQIGSTVAHAATSVWHAVTSIPVIGPIINNTAHFFYHAAMRVVSLGQNLVNSAVHTVTTAINTLADGYNKVNNWVSTQVTNATTWVKQTSNTVANAAIYTYQHPGAALAQAATATGSFLKAHAADIASFVASTAVFMGCEAALGVVTAGPGAVAGEVACGALSGAVGAAVTYGMTTPIDKWNLGDAGAAIGMGALTGAAGSALGSIGTKLFGPVLKAVMGKLGPAALDDAANALADDITENATKDLTNTSIDDATNTATKDANTLTEPHNGGTEPEPNPTNSDSGPTCHSFDPATPVLMADGTTKPIGNVKLGDKVDSTDPTTGKNLVEQVVALHDNHDTDLADVTVQAKDGKTTTLHTTWHHPFWNDTDHQWTDAADLKPGTALRAWNGDQSPAQVVSVKTWTGLHDMDDLTVARTHTYYVTGAGLPLLVHNDSEDCLQGSGPAKGVLEVSDRGKSVGAVKNGLNPAKPRNFVFDPVRGRFATGAYQGILGHDGLRMAIGAGQDDILGGTLLKGPNGELLTDEWSGHYGDKWTDDMRSQFVDFMKGYGFDIDHLVWPNILPGH